MTELQAKLDAARDAIDAIELAANAVVGANLALIEDVAAAGRQYDALHEAHEALKVAYDELLHPNVDSVHIGDAVTINQTAIGWNTIHQQDYSPTTRDMLAQCGEAHAAHIIGFGSTVDPCPGADKPYDWTWLDRMFGPPGNPSGGYLPANRKRILTCCGSPPHMRVPKPGTAPDPMGPRPTGLYDYVPPHYSWHPEFAMFVAAAVVRYEIDMVHFWNEYKGFYVNTPAAGSVAVPPGSGLPSVGGNNRWCTEHATAFFNAIHDKVKAARPECVMAGPYVVCRTYTATPAGDLANGAFPFDLKGPWGFADRKVLRSVMYFLEHCRRDPNDVICLDIKNYTNDKGVLPEYQWDGLAKVGAWIEWLRKLAVWDEAKFGWTLDIPVWFAEAYAWLPGVPAGTLTPATHDLAVAMEAWNIINHVFGTDTAGWMRWKPEGGHAGADPAAGDSIALWHLKGSPKSLQPTEAFGVFRDFVAHFPAGTSFHRVTVDGTEDVTGIASATTLCLVSRSAQPVEVVYGEAFTLKPYEVRFMERTT